MNAKGYAFVEDCTRFTIWRLLYITVLMIKQKADRETYCKNGCFRIDKTKFMKLFEIVFMTKIKELQFHTQLNAI